jgi:hypothetical protein
MRVDQLDNAQRITVMESFRRFGVSRDVSLVGTVGDNEAVFLVQPSDATTMQEASLTRHLTLVDLTKTYPGKSISISTGMGGSSASRSWMRASSCRLTCSLTRPGDDRR